MFPCEFYKIFKNIFFTEHLRTTVSKTYFIERNMKGRQVKKYEDEDENSLFDVAIETAEKN